MATFCALHDVEVKEKGEVTAVEGHDKALKAVNLDKPRRSKVVVSRDVMFDEKAAWDWDSPGTGEAGGFTSTFVVEHWVIHDGGGRWRGGAEHSSKRAEHS